ncbi:hypothetical protein [Polaromonas sp. C04]|uniref:hypothetical protein n=1 Tax=Polaromonas sp. C04 TaxID=1945857 RepID=UPI0011871348|nr:hypothetical protein [Polaromonas sp. C04]
MAVTIVNQREPKPNRGRGHSKALPRVDLNQPGRLRIGHLMTYYDLGHSTVYVHLEKGLIPAADGMVRGRQYWRTETIKNHLEK